MKRKYMLVAATAMMTLAAPTFAIGDDDKVFLQQYEDKVAAARGDAKIAQYGGALLDQATAALKDLRENLDNNDATDTRSIAAQIDTLIEAAKIRAQVAAVKDEIKQLETAQTASAAARAEAAESKVQAVQAQNQALRNQLREYQLRQTQAGATLVLQDVIFTTGSATLAPGATQRLQPLTAYLTSNPNVRVRIDGHTDSQGSAAYNQTLSQNRANSVKAALVTAGIDGGRIDAIGHGESQPVATNATAAGRQQNRRVEITLLGQQVG